MYIYFFIIWIILDILYCFYCFIVFIVLNVYDCDVVYLFLIDLKNFVIMVFMMLLFVDFYEKRKWVGFCCFKRCIRCILIKVFIIFKKNFLFFMGF